MPISAHYTFIFKCIRILDSTGIEDLLSRQFLYIHTGPEKQHDRTYGSLCTPTVTANDLCIRDLGYFHLKDLQHIHDKKVY